MNPALLWGRCDELLNDETCLSVKYDVTEGLEHDDQGAEVSVCSRKSEGDRTLSCERRDSTVAAGAISSRQTIRMSSSRCRGVRREVWVARSFTIWKSFNQTVKWRLRKERGIKKTLVFNYMQNVILIKEDSPSVRGHERERWHDKRRQGLCRKDARDGV